jgi:hypothetical protein
VNKGGEGVEAGAARAVALVVAIGLTLCAAQVAAETADPSPAEGAGLSGLDLSWGLEAGIGGFVSGDANFGAGRVDVRSGEVGGDPTWSEGYLKPGVAVEQGVGAAGTLYGGLSAVGAFTGGEGDPAGYTRSGDHRVSLETAFAGWRSGGLFGDSLGEDALDLSYGRQEFQVGDGFLILDGNLDQFGKGAYWLAPRRSFRQAGLVRVKAAPLQGDLFYLQSDEDQDDTEMAGANLEYGRESFGTLGLMYFEVVDSGPPVVFGARDGMEVFSVRANGLAFPPLPRLSLWGEYVGEQGGGRDGDIDADAWYLEAAYGAEDWPWSPTLSYRYSRFSGDPDPDDGKRGDFDPFFYGWSRGWGTWFQGEITGEYLLFNSNQVTHMLHLSASPTESLTIGAIGYRFDLDQADYFGTPVTDRRFADELNLYLDWAVNDRLALSAVYAIAFPRTAAKEALGDQRFQLLEVAAYLSF